MIFGASLWRCLETAFFVFLGIGALAGMSYLFKPAVRMVQRVWKGLK